MRYAALLRAINVSSTNRISMQALKALFEGLGFKDVTTYLQSGNVVFSAKSDKTDAVELKIEQALHSELGLAVKAIVRDGRYFGKLIENNPFLKSHPDIGFLHVSIFKKNIETQKAGLDEITKDKAEKFSVSRDCVYLSCPNGYGRTKLNNANLEKRLGETGTTRNWKTVLAVHEMVQRSTNRGSEKD